MTPQAGWAGSAAHPTFTDIDGYDEKISEFASVRSGIDDRPARLQQHPMMRTPLIRLR